MRDLEFRWRLFEIKLINDGECIMFSGSRTWCGYGIFYFLGKNRSAHRVAWYFRYGYFPEKNILHSCDKPACVNIEHLHIGTHYENMMDRENRSRKATGVSKYIGVDYHIGDGFINHWVARISHHGKRINVGCFKTEEEAAHARDLASLSHNGLNVKLNFTENKEKYFERICL